MQNNVITYQGPCTLSSKHENCGLTSSYPRPSIDAFLRSFRLPPSRLRYCILHEYMIPRLSSCKDGEKPEFVSWNRVVIVCLNALPHRWWYRSIHSLVRGHSLNACTFDWRDPGTPCPFKLMKTVKTIQTFPNKIRNRRQWCVFAVSDFDS
jgi:hypothetical protein